MQNSDDLLVEKSGILESIIYQNDENAYLVGYFTVEHDDYEENFTVVGNLPGATEGASYLLRGNFVTHKSYGEQFKFQTATELLPTGKEAIINFLSSGAVKGVGPKMAEDIVALLGEETLEIMDNEPERLLGVRGIGKKKADLIVSSYQAHREFANVIKALQPYNIDTSQIMKLYKQFGVETVSVIESDPYSLVAEVRGFSFAKADAIAQRVGIDEDDPSRLTAGVLYLLWRTVQDGNTFLPEEELMDEAVQLLGVSREALQEAIYGMVFSGDIKTEVIDERNVVYPYAYYIAEQEVTKHLVALNNASPTEIHADIEGLVGATERRTGIRFSEEQAEAVKATMDHGVTVITGGPGTGKTTIINGVINILEAAGMEIAVAAPTGRAAKRITETTGHEASTIHRLLECYSENGEMHFGRNAENPLDQNAFIIDEASMIDLMLMKALTEAIKPGSRLVIVGDADQLPSVGAGNVLHDILHSDYIYSVSLTTIFRQARESMIVVNAHRINNGEAPECNTEGGDFFMERKASNPEMADSIVEMCRRRLPGYFEGCDALRDIQVLTPIHKSDVGTQALNKRLQEALNPPSEEKNEKQMKDRIFREGDKVMQIKNNYELEWRKRDTFEEGQGVFNGDVGYIDVIDSEFGTITVLFDDEKYVKYDATNMDQLEPAFAVTVHKSQGSEFPIVVMPMTWFPPMLSTRNLLYTAVTRGKKAVVLVGSEKSLAAMVQNNSIQQRWSGLCQRLRNQL